MIKEAVYAWAERWPHKQYEHISPSSLGGCMRSHFYKLKGVEPTTPPGPGALLNFELGRLWEKPIEDALQDAGIPHIRQLKLYDEKLGMAGTLDLLLFFPETADWELCSIKTEGAMKAKYREREGKNFYQANPEYAIQEQAYKLLLEANGFRVRDTARFIVITKDNGYLDEPVMVFSSELEKATIARIQKLQKHLKENTLPDCECEGWKINYCSFGDPQSIETNKTGKPVPTACCKEELWQPTQ